MTKYPFGLCDTHCDTLLEMLYAHTGFHNDRHHISFDRTDDFAFYTQIMAIYSSARKTDEECWQQFLTACNYAEKCRAEHPGIAACRTKEELESAWQAAKQNE